jgi:hypothetical protein
LVKANLVETAIVREGVSIDKKMAPLEEESLTRGDDVVIADTVTYLGRDLKGKRARIALWDEANLVWAVKLGETGEVIGVRTEKLRKVRVLSLEELPGADEMPERWFEIPKDEINDIDLPAGVEVTMNLETGVKKVRRAAARGSIEPLTTAPAIIKGSPVKVEGGAMKVEGPAGDEL